MVTYDLDLSKSAQKALHADFRGSAVEGGIGPQTERGVAHCAAHFHVAVAQHHELAEAVIAHETYLMWAEGAKGRNSSCSDKIVKC